MNWGLPSLGRWDCNANVLTLVANKTGHTNTVVNTTNLYFNSSYPGPLSDAKYIPTWPIPDTNGKCLAGSILSEVTATWGKSDGTYNYTNVYNYDAADDNNVGGSAITASASASGTASQTVSSSGTATGSSAASTSSSAAVSGAIESSSMLSGLVALVISFLAI